MANNYWMRDNGKSLKTRLRAIYVTFAIAAVAVIVFMFTAAFSARTTIDDRVNFDRLREQIKADSILAVNILDFNTADTSCLTHLPDMPGNCTRLKVDRSIRIGKTFNDKNPVQLTSATRHGIIPLSDVADAWHPSRPLVKIESNNVLLVDDLRHSLPYLVPGAQCLLQEIATTFHDSLEARGGGAYRLKITSLLRTESSVARLRRRNVNATSNSAHLYGTTFDISYSNFICDSLTVARTTEDLKFLLAEILADFRDRGLCWVKHERKQSCFHITVR